jgi:hypothetical protein
LEYIKKRGKSCKKLKRKEWGEKEEFKDLSSINLYKMEAILIAEAVMGVLHILSTSRSGM